MYNVSLGIFHSKTGAVNLLQDSFIVIISYKDGEESYIFVPEYSPLFHAFGSQVIIHINVPHIDTFKVTVCQPVYKKMIANREQCR